MNRFITKLVGLGADTLFLVLLIVWLIGFYFFAESFLDFLALAREG
jgi:hypothetical protein